MEEFTVGEDILSERTSWRSSPWARTSSRTECTMAVVESGARSESSSAWVDTTLLSESEV